MKWAKTTIKSLLVLNYGATMSILLAAFNKPLEAIINIISTFTSRQFQCYYQCDLLSNAYVYEQSTCLLSGAP